MIRSREHTSFSVFGLAFIFVTGGLIALISYILGPLFEWMDRRWHRSGLRKDYEWTSNDTVHLQCIGFKSNGQGEWSQFGSDIPTTKPGDMLKPLLFDELEHRDFGASERNLDKIQSVLTPASTQMFADPDKAVVITAPRVTNYSHHDAGWNHSTPTVNDQISPLSPQADYYGQGQVSPVLPRQQQITITERDGHHEAQDERHHPLQNLPISNEGEVYVTQAS